MAAKAAWSGDENARPDAAPTAGRAGAAGERTAPRPLHPSTSARPRVVRLGYPPSAARLWRMAEGRIVQEENARHMSAITTLREDAQKMRRRLRRLQAFADALSGHIAILERQILGLGAEPAARPALAQTG